MTDTTSTPQNELKVGDKVSWRGSWGSDPAVEATVISIERCSTKRAKYGDPVESISWDDIEYANVTLDTGCWAYGEQLAPAR